jgi:uncharacterized protein with HEPN domain
VEICRRHNVRRLERHFEIIREALCQLAKVDQQLVNQITDYQKIVSFRNVPIHGYADVYDELLWDIVATRLPVLREEIGRLIGGRLDNT